MDSYMFSKQESRKNIGKANSLWKPDFLSVKGNCFCYKSHSIFHSLWALADLKRYIALCSYLGEESALKLKIVQGLSGVIYIRN